MIMKDKNIGAKSSNKKNSSSSSNKGKFVETPKVGPRAPRKTAAASSPKPGSVSEIRGKGLAVRMANVVRAAEKGTRGRGGGNAARMGGGRGGFKMPVTRMK